MSYHDLLEGYPVHIQRSVTWGSMDAFQHVNNTVYFRYFEDVRIAYFEEARIIEYMQEHNIGPILASTQCRFKAPLSYPDTVYIGAKVTDIEQDRFTMEYIVVSETLQRVAAKGSGLIVSYNYAKNEKADLPDEWVSFIHKQNHQT